MSPGPHRGPTPVGDDEPVSFLGRPPPGHAFRTRLITLAPGCSHAFVAAEWADAMVVVEGGELDLECVEGGHRRFGPGAVLCLAGLALRALRNPGGDPLVLVVVSRRRGALAEPQPWLGEGRVEEPEPRD